jgi:hypothetical protein
MFVRYAYPPNALGYCGPLTSPRSGSTRWPLCWDGRLLTLGEAATETARLALDGSAIADGIGPGDWVSLHWDWICDRLTQRQLRALRDFTLRHLDLVNHRVEHPGTVAILG